MPRHDNPHDSQTQSSRHVQPARSRFAVKGGVLGGHDARGDQERDTGIVDARETLHQRAVRDGVHSVPHAAANEALARCYKEKGYKKEIQWSGEGVVEGVGEIVEGEYENEQKAQKMRPDVNALVGKFEDWADALDARLAESVAFYNVRVYPPWSG